MTYFIKNGNTFNITNEANIDIRKELPVGTYTIKQSMTGLYLEQQPDAVIEHKVYGGAHKRAARIIKTFGERPGSTGVALQGEKGSGKTLLARMLSQQLRDVGVSTFLVNTPFAGESFNTFLSQIEQPIMVLFDEFEKVYDMDTQNKLLTLFDGTHQSKKLFVITLNDSYRMSEFMKNRPGRFYYAYKYDGLEEDEVRGYCEDVLINKGEISSIITFSKTFGKFNFDILKAIVEEMNRYGERVGDVVQHLNARPTETAMNLTVEKLESKELKAGMKVQEKLGVINPFASSFYVWASGTAKPKGLTLTKSGLVDDDDDEDDYIEFEFSPSDLVRMTDGQFVYSNDRATVILTKTKERETGYDQFIRGL